MSEIHSELRPRVGVVDGQFSFNEVFIRTVLFAADVLVTMSWE